MATFEVNFSAYHTVVADSTDDAKEAFIDFMNNEYPEFDVDRVFNIEEVK